MKLIDLLVTHLGSNGGWPIGAEVCAQDNDCEIVFYSRPGIHRRGNNLVWTIPEGVDSKVVKRRIYLESADDMQTKVIHRNQYEVALAASKHSEWDGEGVPEKGDLCIYRDKDEGPIETVVIASFDDGGDVVIWHKPKRGRDYSVDSLCFFEAAVNEEDNKRIRVAQTMCDILGNGITVDEKEGYGKAWLDAYDAIAAGKIPGIRLTDDAGN